MKRKVKRESLEDDVNTRQWNHQTHLNIIYTVNN